MCLKIVVIVCGFSTINATIFPLIDPIRLYNYIPPENEVTFHFYHRDYLSKDYQIFIGNESSLAETKFDPELPTKIIVHGWTHGKDVPWLVELREVLAETGMWNVIVVDWSNLSHVVYVEARIHNLVVAKQLKRLLLFLIDYKEIQMSSVHLIGHSMGAQISATTANNLESRTGQRIGRITGLDPAAPLYEWPHIESLDELLDPSDAEFVDVIHTNGRHLGMITPAGHVDFYPNGGEIQTGCKFWACSHLRACEYFIASVRKPDLFKAISYQSWKDYLQGEAGYLEAYPMGIAASSDIPNGIYYVEANEEYKEYIIIADSKVNANKKSVILPEEKYNATNFMTLWEFDGVLKYSPLFYGWYTSNTKGYRLAIAYFITGLVVYAYSFFATLRKMAENSRMSKLSEKDDECIFSWKLFTAWDYMIGNAETAHNRVASIVMGFKEALLEEAEKKKDTRNWKVIGCRIFVNLIVIGLLSLSVYLIVIVVDRSTQTDSQNNFWRKNETSFVIALITFFFPMIFEVLGLLEQYHPRKQLRLQLARIMVLNLLNLYSLIFALFDRISGMTEKLERNWNISQYLKKHPKLYTAPSSNLTSFYNETCEICIDYQPSMLIAESLISELSRNVSFEVLPQLWQIMNDLMANMTALNNTLLEISNGTFLRDFSQLGNVTFTNNTSEFYADVNITEVKQLFVDYLTYILYSIGDYYSTTDSSDNYTTIIPGDNYTDYNYSSTINPEGNYTNMAIANYSDFQLIFKNFSSTVLPFIENITESTSFTDLTEFSTTETTEEDRFDHDLSTTTEDILSTISQSYFPKCEGCRKVWIPYEMNYTMKAELRNLCWETMFGQELVKLTVTDLIMSIVPTLGMEFFRGIFVRVMNRCWCWDLEKKFPQYGDFKVAENILSLVNNQGMVWMGMFFSPGIVALNVVKLYILMYFRGWAVMTCNSPPEVIFRASRSHNFYYALLLMMLFLCVLPVGYTIVWIRPSWHCGPFTQYKRIFHIFTKTIKNNSPEKFNRVLDYIASPGIVIPLLVLLILIIYYLISLTNALREANDDLKIQLRRERTEERRKMFQMSDRRRRVGSGESNELSNTPFNKWKKVLGNLPSGKSIDETPKQEFEDIEEPVKEENGTKGRDFFTKLIKRALGKSSTSEDDQNAEDGTDTEQHDSLPYDNAIAKPRPHRPVKPSFSFGKTDFQSIAHKAFQLKKSITDSNANDDDNIADSKHEERNYMCGQNSDLRKDAHKKKLTMRGNKPSTSESVRQDSESSVWSDNIPVITISKTESAENILGKNSNATSSSSQLNTKRDTENYKERKFTPKIKCVLKKQSAEIDEETIRYFSKDLEDNQMENNLIKALTDDAPEEKKYQNPSDNFVEYLEEPLTDRSSSEETELKESSTDTVLLSPITEKEQRN